MNLASFIRRSLVMVSFLTGWVYSFAQSITGTTCVNTTTAYQYTLSGTWTSSTLTWSVTGGTISSSSSGTDLTQITVTWSGSGTGTVNVTTSSPTGNYSLNVSIYAPLTAGAITSGANQGINYNTTPASITCAAPSAGYCTPYYLYNWWYSTDQDHWYPLSGAHSLSINFGTTTLTQTTYYKLDVIEGNTSSQAWSSVTAVYVWPPGQSGIVAGYTCMTTGTQDQYTLSCNCTDSTTMTWSVAGGTISGSSSGTGLTQIPVTWNRAGTDSVSVITSNPADTFSLVVTSCPSLSGGTITSGANQTINYNTIPANIICSGASGGNCFPEYDYQWLYSTNGTTWNHVSGALSLTLDLSTTALTQTTYYRCLVDDVMINTGAYSSIATVTVYPQLVSGSITPSSESVNFNSVPGQLTEFGMYGGSGTYTYQWQSASVGVGSFTPISGATSGSYAPGPLTTSTWYNVITTCNGVSVTSAPVLVRVNPPLAPGTINPANVIINAGTSPGLLTSTAATGGGCSGSYSYQWQSSAVGTTRTNISGATSLTYNPGNLSSSINYQVQVICGGDTVYTPSVAVQIGTVATDLNYIRTRTLSLPGVTDTVTSRGLTSPYDVQQSTIYYDGLGRPIQTVAMQASPLQNDMVTMHAYDPSGRESTTFLPYTSPSNDGNYKSNPTDEQNNFLSAQYPGEQYFYGKDGYENSPLNRVLTTAAAGNSWAGSDRAVSQQYLINTAADSVHIWNITFGAGSVPTDGGLYAAGSLFKTLTTDEQGNQVAEYKDYEGRVVLKKVQSSTIYGTATIGWLCTYYVYDDFNHLRFVVSPQAVQLINIGTSWSIPSGIAAELCFRYEYDLRQRMIVKQVPGAGQANMVYDVRDRLVMSQDANLQAIQKWEFTCYDGLDRPDSTGLMTDPANYNNLPYHTNLALQSPTYPSLASYTTELMTQTFYDGYPAIDAVSSLPSAMATNYTSVASDFVTTLNTSPTYAVALTMHPITRGLVTGKMTKVIGTTSQYLYSENFYDDRGRAIQTQSVNYTGGIDTTTTQYDFTGKPLRDMLSHAKLQNTPQYHTVVTKMDYDPAFRLRYIWKNIDAASSDQLIDSMQYNELGQLSAKYLGNEVDSLVYTYNIRGWLSGINPNYVAGTTNHYFGMELGYDKTTSVAPGNTYFTPEYNGNIEGTVWKSAGSGLNRKYDFTYDPVNRITGAAFLQNSSGSSWDKNQVDFSVSNLGYDANGNILSMTQNGFLAGGSKAIDQLSYTYLSGGSNKLIQVMDGANIPTSQLGDFHYPSTKVAGTNDYAYDGNGNLTQDNNKAITAITYNYLNLPQLIHFQGKGNISYVYDGSGEKLVKITADSMARHAIRTLYLDGMVYQQTDTLSNPGGATDTLQFISHEEGRVRWAYHIYTTGPPGYGYSYDFFEKDHLGNTRMVLTQERDTTNYIATMEATYRTTESQLFGNIAGTSVAWTSMPSEAQNIPSTVRYPSGATVNDSVSQVTGNPGQTTGPSLLLKVMAGDTITPAVQCYYVTNSATTTNSSFNSVLNSLAAAIMGTPTGATEGVLSNYTSSSGTVYSGLSSFLSTKDPAAPSGYPKAYLNWILLDDQFNYVSSSSGSVAAASTTYPANQMNTLAAGGPIVMARNGYLYVWVSNETQGWDVFFDNFSVQYKQGPVLEENHYYPFGLTMAGISDKALKTNYAENKYRFNKGSELQHKEFSDGSGLELYSTNYRSLDPQLGRFWQIDPLADINEDVSTYSFADNNPILLNDPFGLMPDSLPPVTVTAHKNSTTSIIPPLSPVHTRVATDNVPAGMAPRVNPSMRFIPADVANKAYSQPPYAKGTTVTQYRTTVKQKFVRVFNSKNGNSAQGKWMMKESEIQGLTPEQIQSKFALPGQALPNEIVEVEVPAGTLMQVGYAGTNAFGTGGGVQFEALEALPTSAFGTPTALPVPSVPMEVPAVGFPEEPIIPEGEIPDIIIP